MSCEQICSWLTARCPKQKIAARNRGDFFCKKCFDVLKKNLTFEVQIKMS